MSAEVSGALCSMEEEPARRVRRRCPHCWHLQYGTLRTYYDTIRLFFDCGATLDYGYGQMSEPGRSRWKPVTRRQVRFVNGKQP